MIDGHVKTMSHNCGDTAIQRLNKKGQQTEYKQLTKRQTEEIKIDDFEHIETIECTYSDRGVHSLKIKTNTGQQIQVEGSAGQGQYRREIRLRSHNKAVIGFRGTF